MPYTSFEALAAAYHACGSHTKCYAFLKRLELRLSRATAESLIRQLNPEFHPSHHQH